jgi:hypothetical protein
MQLLYDSESFVVVQIHANLAPEPAARPAARQLDRHGYEIVDKRSGMQVYLDGSWADMFEQRLDGWQKQTPTQQEVEDALEGYSGLANTPVSLH